MEIVDIFALFLILVEMPPVFLHYNSLSLSLSAIYMCNVKGLYIIIYINHINYDITLIILREYPLISIS